MPDRLPSLIVLVGFWVPPAAAGWASAVFLQQSARRYRTIATRAAMTAFVPAYAAAWFVFNLHRMPPYIPGATMDPTYASPEATQALAIFTGVSILPGGALACALAFRLGRRVLRERAHAERHEAERH
jgi:hypothetical protein